MLSLSLLVLVSFDPTFYSVTEGVDDNAILRLVRTGDLSRETVVTVNPTPGSALGIDLLLQGLCNSSSTPTRCLPRICAKYAILLSAYTGRPASRRATGSLYPGVAMNYRSPKRCARKLESRFPTMSS